MTEQMIAQQAWYVKSKVMRVETFILLEPTSAVMVLIHCFLTCISTDMIERGLRRQPSTDSCALDDAAMPMRGSGNHRSPA